MITAAALGVSRYGYHWANAGGVAQQQKAAPISMAVSPAAIQPVSKKENAQQGQEGFSLFQEKEGAADSWRTSIPDLTAFRGQELGTGTLTDGRNPLAWQENSNLQEDLLESEYGFTEYQKILFGIEEEQEAQAKPDLQGSGLPLQRPAGFSLPVYLPPGCFPQLFERPCPLGPVSMLRLPPNQPHFLRASYSDLY